MFSLFHPRLQTSAQTTSVPKEIDWVLIEKKPSYLSTRDVGSSLVRWGAESFNLTLNISAAGVGEQLMQQL